MHVVFSRATTKKINQNYIVKKIEKNKLLQYKYLFNTK